MYARTPRDADTPPTTEEQPPARARAGWMPLALLPGALCAAAVAGLRLTDGRPRLIAAVVGASAVLLAVRAVLRRGPLSAGTRTSGIWTCWLLGYALLGDGLLDAAVAGGPDGLPDGTTDGPWPVTVAPVLALALACAPAAASAHLFAVRARRKLTASRGLADFSASVRPLLLGTFALFMGALTVLTALSAAVLGEPPPTPGHSPSVPSCCWPGCSPCTDTATPPRSSWPRRPPRRRRRRPRSSPPASPAAASWPHPWKR